MGPDLASAQLVRVLNSNERLKWVALLVTMRSAAHPEPTDTVILAERTAFPEDGDAALGAILHGSAPSAVQLVDANDIYYRYVVMQAGRAVAKFQAIHPATPKHVLKYTRQDRFMVRETPELYARLVLPHIEANPAARLQWVQNILAGTSEADSILHRDADPRTGFVLAYDSKWGDRTNLAGLYLLAISQDSRIRSLRDLTGDHLGLLTGIRDTVRRTVAERFPSVQAAQLRCFVHYQPTYYHFHVHVVHIDADSCGALVGQAHLLEDVIDNIAGCGSDYYQRRTLHYQLGAEHALYGLLAGEGGP